MTGTKWFSILDLLSGDYHVPMAKEDKGKNSIHLPTGFFQFERMPQGITGAQTTFQRSRGMGDYTTEW